MKGFSLIELLATVLIAGILASIALPQYQKAVERSRSSEAMTIATAIVDAQNRSLDAYPNAPVNNRRALDVSIPGGEWSSDGSTYTTAMFAYTLNDNGVSACRRENGSCKYTLEFYNHNGVIANGVNRACTGSTSFCGGIEAYGFDN